MKGFNFIVLIAFYAIFFQGCNNDWEDLSKTKEIPENGILESINFSEVYVNPYDYVGKYHNDGLNYVFENYYKRPMMKSLSEEAKDDILRNLIFEYCTENPIVDGFKNDSSIIFEKVITKSHDNKIFINEKQQQFFEQVWSLYRNQVASSPQDFITRINKIEANISISELTEIEKVQLLVSTAVAKFSACFWMDQMLLKNQTTTLKTRSTEADWLDWFRDVFMPKAEKVLEADFAGAAAGAVEGLVFGGAVGSIVPGAGTITVAITGAVTDGAKGAIVNSTLEGIGVNWKFWTWF